MNAFDAGESSTGAEEIEKPLKMRKEEGVETGSIIMRRRRAGMTAEQRRIERTRNYYYLLQVIYKAKQPVTPDQQVKKVQVD